MGKPAAVLWCGSITVICAGECHTEHYVHIISAIDQSCRERWTASNHSLHTQNIQTWSRKIPRPKGKRSTSAKIKIITFRSPDVNFPPICYLGLKINSLWKIIVVAGSALVGFALKASISLKDCFSQDSELGWAWPQDFIVMNSFIIAEIRTCVCLCSCTHGQLPPLLRQQIQAWVYGGKGEKGINSEYPFLSICLCVFQIYLMSSSLWQEPHSPLAVYSEYCRMGQERGKSGKLLSSHGKILPSNSTSYQIWLIFRSAVLPSLEAAAGVPAPLQSIGVLFLIS